MSTQAAAAQGADTGSLAPNAKVTITKDTANGTDYVVLKKKGAEWSVDGPTQHARSANEAIKQAAQLRIESKVDAGGTYIAIPARSFTPVAVKSEVTTTLKLEEAK